MADEMEKVDKIDLSLDEIITLQKKERRNATSQARGRGRGRGRGAAAVRGNIKAFRGRVGAKALRGRGTSSSLPKGISPLNRQANTAKTRQLKTTRQQQNYTYQQQTYRQSNSRRGTTRGRGGYRGRVRQAVQQVNRQAQQFTQRTNRQQNVNQRRGIATTFQQPQTYTRGQGRTRGRLNRRFGAMRSDVVVSPQQQHQQLKPRRRWNRDDSASGDIMTVSIQNQSPKVGQDDVQVVLPSRGKGQGSRGRGRGRGRGSRQQSLVTSPIQEVDDISDEVQFVLPAAPRVRGSRPGRGRGRGRGTQRPPRVTSPIAMTQEVVTVEPAVRKTNYNLNKISFPRAQTGKTLSDRFARAVAYGTTNGGAASGGSSRQVFL